MLLNLNLKINMPRTSQDAITNTFALLLVGNPKVGKTRVVTSFPDVYVLDLDKNINSAVAVAGTRKFWYDYVDVDDQNKPIEPEKQWLRLIELFEKAMVNPQYKTIAIDSITRLDEISKNYILGELRRAGVKLRSDTIDDQLRITDYETHKKQFLRTLAKARACGKYVVWTSHQVYKENELTETPEYILSISGALKATFGGYFTDVWGMQAKEAAQMVGGKAVMSTKYTIRTKPTNGFVALGSSIKAPAEIDITDKTQEQIWQIIEPFINLPAKPSQ